MRCPCFQNGGDGQEHGDTTVTFDLLSDDFWLEETQNNVQITNEQQEELNKIIDAIENPATGEEIKKKRV